VLVLVGGLGLGLGIGIGVMFGLHHWSAEEVTRRRRLRELRRRQP
jgi:hypothetical protein